MDPKESLYKSERVPIKITTYPAGTSPAAVDKTGPVGIRQQAVEIDFHNSPGERLYGNGTTVLQVPRFTDSPITNGIQLQVVDRSDLNSKGEGEMRTAPLFKANPKNILKDVAVATIAEKYLVGRTYMAWANLNLHTRPPVNVAAQHDVQYDPLVVDIHGRDIWDPYNWAKPPQMHGVFGSKELDRKSDWKEFKGSVDKNGKPIPATQEEVKAFKASQIKDQQPGITSNPRDFDGWETHRTGKYQTEGERTTPEATVNRLKEIFGTEMPAGTTLIDGELADLKELELFKENDPEQRVFEENDTDIELWRFGGMQLVTQRNPLVPPKEGIHMVLKLRPEPHTPWENMTQNLEAWAVGIGVARLLRETKSMGEIGDAYLDMNANWSMVNKKGLTDEMPLDDLKKEIQKGTRAHLHIQLEKMGASWEIPPAPGTFPGHKLQPQEVIDEIRTILGKENGGLKDWLLTNCRGKILTQ